jgi:hypothetical protein
VAGFLDLRRLEDAQVELPDVQQPLLLADGLLRLCPEPAPQVFADLRVPLDGDVLGLDLRQLVERIGAGRGVRDVPAFERGGRRVLVHRPELGEQHLIDAVHRRAGQSNGQLDELAQERPPRTRIIGMRHDLRVGQLLAGVVHMRRDDGGVQAQHELRGGEVVGQEHVDRLEHLRRRPGRAAVEVVDQQDQLVVVCREIFHQRLDVVLHEVEVAGAGVVVRVADQRIRCGAGESVAHDRPGEQVPPARVQHSGGGQTYRHPPRPAELQVGQGVQHRHRRSSVRRGTGTARGFAATAGVEDAGGPLARRCG